MNKFLIKKFGKEKGNYIYKCQLERLEYLLKKSECTRRSKNQINTLKKTILPRIALYQVLQDIGQNKKESYKIIEDYMFNVVCVKMSNQLKKFDKLPFVYHLFKKTMLNNLLKNDNWESSLEEETKESFTAHVHKCLWYDATVENNCTEICEIFCKCDDINFSSLSKVDFYRQGSLGLNGDKCDFKFSKANKI